jgi:hypothetical protein
VGKIETAYLDAKSLYRSGQDVDRLVYACCFIHELTIEDSVELKAKIERLRESIEEDAYLDRLEHDRYYAGDF